jgi:hypothetical protein
MFIPIDQKLKKYALQKSGRYSLYILRAVILTKLAMTFANP